MTKTDKWIDATYKELEKKIKEQEDEFVDLFLLTFLSEFEVEDGNLKNSTGNYDKVNQINKQFDNAYDLFIIPFLLWYGSKLLEAGKISLDYFTGLGVSTSERDIAYLGTAIGLDGKKIIKGSFLWNLGMMGEMRQKLQDKTIQAVSSSQKFNLFLANTKPIFKSKGTTRSALSKFYLKYAYNPIMQTLNSVGHKLAVQYEFDSFLYAGDLVEKSRDFCIERAGNTYTMEEGKAWNDEDWDGKMDGTDFFVAIGGHFCKHHLEYFNSNEE